jgi:hypothetical protein
MTTLPHLDALSAEQRRWLIAFDELCQREHRLFEHDPAEYAGPWECVVCGRSIRPKNLQLACYDCIKKYRYLTELALTGAEPVVWKREQA